MIVATVRALKHHGGVAKDALNQENLAALEKGMANLERHVHNVKNVYGIPCVVSVNRFTADTQAEMDLLTARVAKLGVKVVVATHWADGGAGAANVANIVVDLCNEKSNPTFVYEDSDPLWEKMKKVATKVYGAADITADTKVRNRIKELQEGGYGHYPVCVAKTQSSFSTDPNLRGAPSGHIVNVREVRLAARSLPVHQQKKAVFWGAGAAVILRIVLTIVAVELLKWSYLKIVGGLALFWIAIGLLVPDDGGDDVDGSDNLFQAIKTILIADLVMSVDNVIAVAAAAKGSILLLVLGLAISIPLVIFGATLLMKLMERRPPRKSP